MNKASMLYPKASTTRRVIDLCGLWGFRLDWKSEGQDQRWQDGLPQPESMPVPAAFADFFTDKESRDYSGDFWYETEVFIPKEWENMDISIRFGCATHRATIYINGDEIGYHEGGFLPFSITLSGHVNFNQPNHLAVKVNNELREDCIPVGRTLLLPNGRKLAKGYFDFFNYSGLLRPIKLVAVPKMHIIDYEVNHMIADNRAEVTYSVSAHGNYEITVSVLDENGVEVACATGAQGVLEVKNVHLWEIHNAYLYQFIFRMLDGEQLIDEYFDNVGIRTFDTKGKELLLNGKPIYLKGFGKHEESSIVGRGFQLGVIKRDFELMKWCGANSFRTAHYPYSEEVYQLADREGILVIDETPAVGLMASTINFFDATQGPQTHFFERETTPQLLKNHLDALEDLITRDKNHACVIAWCLLNEPESTDDSALPYLEAVFKKAHDLDPQKRPCTFTSLMSAMPDKCKCYHLCDFISLNRYYGWYVLGGSELSVAEMAFHREMKAWEELAPNTPFMFAEYGADTSSLIHKLPSVMWSQEYQKEYLEMCHRVFDSYDFVRGEHVWTFSDFQTGEGTMRLNGNKKGIFTRDRQPKDAAYYLKERWDRLPLDYKCR